MAKEVLLPQLGQSVESCIIIEWKKKEGDTVSKGEVICEVETDKSTLEVESTESGRVLKLLYDVGDDVPVFSPIMVVGEEGEEWNPQESKDVPISKSEDTTEDISEKSTVKERVSMGGEIKIEDSDDKGFSEKLSREFGVRENGERVKISPRARKLAEERRIDYFRLTGSGPGGRIIERDILRALEQGYGDQGMIKTSTPRASNYSSDKGDIVREVEISGVRKVIAERMLSSIQQTAQYTNNTYADVSRLLNYRKRLKENRFNEALKGITIGDLVNYAVVKTLRDFPYMNSLFMDNRIVERSDINLGFAVDTPRGLYVPVVKGAERLSLLELSLETKRLAEACLNGTITPDDLDGGTFTVTNLGMFGIESFTPILNPPQVAILGICNIVPKPVYVDEPGGRVEFVPSIGLSLTLDHRVVDGAPASRFLVALRKAIENFDLLLA